MKPLKKLISNVNARKKFDLAFDGFYLPPEKKLPDNIRDELDNINDQYSKKRINHPQYMKEIQRIFGITPIQVTEEAKIYLAGFFEGEGSLNVSIKKGDPKKDIPVYLDPDFNLTQHANGVSNLYLAMEVFQTGRIGLKKGSLATLVYGIGDRKNLISKIVPFYEKYVYPYGSQVKRRRAEIFKEILALLENKAHQNKERMINELLPLWDAMRVHINFENSTFNSLESALAYMNMSPAERQVIIDQEKLKREQKKMRKGTKNIEKNNRVRKKKTQK